MNEENTTNEQNLSEEEKPVTDTNNENTSVTEEEKLKKQVAELNDKYLRLYSEFDNFRKRTMKEKSELIKTASEDVLKSVLPVIDDFERAIKANETVTEAGPIKEGITLIYNKLKNSTQLKGLTAFESIGQDFNADTMEAITHIPATDENQKGKVVDEVEKGYKLGDKVIRYAKVVVAN
ncbi:MAG: nucleotide exchange factor GrpE [Sphingobacteriaceae bacterium]|nr:nucleotide exchange factor GrpE [Sphingobacteriaceae bacterium]